MPCFWRIFRGPFDALKCAPVYKSSKTKVFKPASLCSRGLFLPHTYHSVSEFIEVILSDRNLHLNMKKEKQIKKGSVVVLWLLLLSHSKKAGGFLCWVFLFFQCLRLPSTKKCILWADCQLLAIVVNACVNGCLPCDRFATYTLSVAL